MAVEPSQRNVMGHDSPMRNVVSMLVGNKMPPLPQQSAMGFFTDTSLCIGCKACEVACKQWNQLPASDPGWTGSSYDNTGQLSDCPGEKRQHHPAASTGNRLAFL